MKNKKILPVFLLAACLVLSFRTASAAPGPGQLIPKPASYTSSGQPYAFRADGRDVRIVSPDRGLRRELASLPEFAREEAYRLTVSARGIEIRALSDKGVLRARQSLDYLKALSEDGTIEQCTVTDWPRFQHRGLMLDISRNFRSKEFILKQIDAMSLVKLNSLHLHLTDAAGWRLQIDRYPRLTGYAAWRPGEHFTDWRSEGGGYLEEGDPRARGGYLTKDDVREIVAYAQARGVNIIPEIEMPGHSGEVTAAYPELSCLRTDEAGHTVQVPTPDVCPANEEVYTFFENVLSEVMDLFPSRLIHIGGDEASRRAWRSCPRCQALMQKEGMTDVAELQSYMTRRIERFLSNHGRTLLGWDEIMEGGLAPEATVMSWRGVRYGNEAIAAGHDVIMSPVSNCYLDYPQDEPSRVPPAFGSYQPLKNVYKFDPQSPDVDPALLPHLLGVQGNLWTEYVPTDEHAEFQLYPRAFAIAEVGWSRQEDREYDGFRDRALALVEVLRGRGYHPFDLASEFGDRPEATRPAVHQALGCPVAYTIPFSAQYPATRERALTDGLRGGYSYHDAVWQGFNSDMDVTVDLGSVRPVHFVGAVFMSLMGVNIALPEKTEVYVSVDGENYTLLCQTFREIPDASQTGQLFVLYGESVQAQARFVRYRAFRQDAPRHDWLFTDELLIN